jgi:hypothetical protein
MVGALPSSGEGAEVQAMAIEQTISTTGSRRRIGLSMAQT